MSANKGYGARCFAYGYIFAGGKTDDAQRIVAAIFDMDEKLLHSVQRLQ